MLRRPVVSAELSTLARACRRGERDRGRLVAVELHGQLRRRDVPARSGCDRFALARAIVAVRLCGAQARRGLSSAGRCPTRSVAWRASRRSRACAPARRPAALVPAAAIPRLYAPGLVLRLSRTARRVITGYPGLVGTVPPTISALTAITSMYVPCTRGRFCSHRCGACLAAQLRGRGWAVGSARPHAFAARDQVFVQERLHRPYPGEHHGAHPAGRPVRPAAAV
jgi:hypothetical protein